MRVAVLTSTGLRHRYFLQTISENFDVALALHQPKERYYEKQQSNSEIVREHFRRLAQSERDEFEPRLTKTYYLSETDDINAHAWEAERAGVEYVLLFGTAILKDDWLGLFHDRIINLHLGLAPFYRGSATLFWPVANSEPERVGATIHLATRKVDSGPILKHVRAIRQANDDYYSYTTRLIRRAIDLVPPTLMVYAAGQLKPTPQVIETKAYRRADFNETILTAALRKFSENSDCRGAPGFKA